MTNHLVSEMRVVHIDAAAQVPVVQIHEQLKSTLNFPSYYGMNCAALQDCLSDIETPVKLVFHIGENTLDEDDKRRDIFAVVMRNVSSNPALSCSFVHTNLTK